MLKFNDCRNIGEDINQIIRFDQAILLVEETFDLATPESFLAKATVHKDSCPQIHFQCMHITATV